MNATAPPDVIQVTDYQNGSDSDTNIDDNDNAPAVEFYQPVSAVDSEDNEDQIEKEAVPIHSQLHSNGVTGAVETTNICLLPPYFSVQKMEISTRRATTSGGTYDFSHEENDNTELVTMADVLGRNCPRLQNIHIASIRLSNAVVLALTTTKLRGLRILSLVLGCEITDASVATIASSYQNLESYLQRSLPKAQMLLKSLVVIGALLGLALGIGSELLLEILSPGIIGGLFLPILGALPDAMLILVPQGMNGSTRAWRIFCSVWLELGSS
ncbi:hypothetical protein PS1_002418 [Malus domestica]